MLNVSCSNKSLIAENSLPTPFSSIQKSSSSKIGNFCQVLKEKIVNVWNRILACLLSIFTCKKKIAVKEIENRTAPQINTTDPKKAIPKLPQEPKNTPKPIATPKDEIPTPVKASTPFGKLPPRMNNHILSFLPVEDILAFQKASKENRIIGDHNMLWSQLISRDIQPLRFVREPSKKRYIELSRKVALVALKFNDPHSAFKEFTYRHGVTTMGELKKKISKETGIPLSEVSFHHIGVLIKEQNTLLSPHPMGPPGYLTDKEEDDNVLCSDAIEYYNCLEGHELPKSLKAKMHLALRLGRL